jgi:hypothetical protein
MLAAIPSEFKQIMCICVFKRGVMRKIFRFKRQEITRGCRLSKGLNKFSYNLLYNSALIEVSVCSNIVINCAEFIYMSLFSRCGSKVTPVDDGEISGHLFRKTSPSFQGGSIIIIIIIIIIIHNSLRGE